MSIIEAEYIALSAAAREVLVLRELIVELKNILDIPEVEQKIRYTLFEYNKYTEELAKLPKNRPRTTHMAVTYQHFRSAVKCGILLIKMVDTIEQLLDIFTKMIVKQPLEYLRKMGWPAILSHACTILYCFLAFRAGATG